MAPPKTATNNRALIKFLKEKLKHRKSVSDNITYPAFCLEASKDEKVGLAVGVTEKLTNKYDAVKFAKIGSEIIGGKGGGGRKDFAQAGGQDKNKIDEAFEKIKSLI